jgi:Uma2 family endonuclease
MSHDSQGSAAMNQPQAAIRRHKLTVADYYRMAEVGILAPEARVELIEGEIVDMVPMGSRHAAAISLFTQRLTIAVTPQALVRCQLPLRLGDLSEPEPDLAVVRPHPDRYFDAHPTAADTLLVIEVADSSLAYDRDIKIPLYARHCVPAVWLIDLNAGTLLACSGADLAGREELPRPQQMAVPGMNGVNVDLSGLF